MGVMMLAGCGNHNTNAVEKSQADTEEDRESAVFADTQCPTSLDPAESWNSWYTSRYGITETLYKLDENLEAQPFLAKVMRNER